MKTMLILTGPQGSGNHMWSKIFALHPLVYGWRDLLDAYWIGHDREPFSDFWRDPDSLVDFDWNQGNYYVTSISVPYMENGRMTVPDIERFQQVCREQGVITKIAVLGRDRNILGMQEQRLRGGETYHQALSMYQRVVPDIFLGYELLHLYRRDYLRQVSKTLDFPIWADNIVIDTILEEDSNGKYFQPVAQGPIDDLARRSSSQWR